MKTPLVAGSSIFGDVQQKLLVPRSLTVVPRPPTARVAIDASVDGPSAKQVAALASIAQHEAVNRALDAERVDEAPRTVDGTTRDLAFAAALATARAPACNDGR